MEREKNSVELFNEQISKNDYLLIVVDDERNQQHHHLQSNYVFFSTFRSFQLNLTVLRSGILNFKGIHCVAQCLLVHSTFLELKQFAPIVIDIFAKAIFAIVFFRTQPFGTNKRRSDYTQIVVLMCVCARVFFRLKYMHNLNSVSPQRE